MLNSSKCTCALILTLILFSGLACSRFADELGSGSAKKEIVELPAYVEPETAEVDYDIYLESSMVLALTLDDKLFRERRTKDSKSVTNEGHTNLSIDGVLRTFVNDRSPDKRIVYFKGDVNGTFGDVLKVFDVVRRADIDRVGLVVLTKQDGAGNAKVEPARFELRLPQPSLELNRDVKPNPLTLIASLDRNGRIYLNQEDKGTLSETERLTGQLKQIFAIRESEAVFRDGTNEVEKTVFLKVTGSTKYGDLVKMVEAVKLAGASPIGIQIDDIVD